MKLGSLKPSRYSEPAGICASSDPEPQIIGTNGIAAAPAGGWVAQLYHHAMPVVPDEGKNAALGAAFVATPRLH